LALQCPATGASLSRPGMLQCNSDIYVGKVQNSSAKGITLDDTTLRYCADRIPELWPNSASSIKTMRMFRSWSPDWEEENRVRSWTALVAYAQENGVKVLVAAPVTCFPKEDEQDWRWTKELMRMLGRDHVMGIAIGNELELLSVSQPRSCVEEVWDGGRLWRLFTQRVAEADKMGFEGVPVTTVFTAKVIYDGYPFANVKGQVLAQDFFVNATRKYGKRFVFVFNIYPYFDSSLKLDPGSTTRCTRAVKKATCWHDGCLGYDAMKLARQRMKALTGHGDLPFWIGEVGWSSPAAVTLPVYMQQCEDFSSLATLRKFYSGFVKWNLSLTGYRPPHQVFYFTMRDSMNYGIQEYFGLLDTCKNDKCKIQTANYTAFEAVEAPIRPKVLQGGILLILACNCLMTLFVWMFVRATRRSSRSLRRQGNAGDAGDSDEEE